MNFGEVYTSLQSGVLDGYEHTATTTASFKFYEIAKYYALTQHLIDPTVVAFSLSEWKKLDDKEQAVVLEGAKLATDIARAMSPVRDAEGMAELQKRGMTITRPDMTEARKAAAGFQQEMAAKLKAEHLLKQIPDQQSPGPTSAAAGPAGPCRTLPQARLRGGARRRPLRSGRPLGNQHESTVRSDRSRHRDDRGGNLCRHGWNRRLAGLQSLCAEHDAELERGSADLRPHLARVSGHPDRLPARRPHHGRGHTSRLVALAQSGARSHDRAVVGGFRHCHRLLQLSGFPGDAKFRFARPRDTHELSLLRHDPGQHVSGICRREASRRRAADPGSRRASARGDDAMIAFLLTALLGVMLLGIPILISIALIGFVGMALLPDVVMPLFAQKMFGQLDSFTLLAMPYFILAGSIMTAGGISKQLVDFARALVGHFRAGLAHASVVGSMVMY